MYCNHTMVSTRRQSTVTASPSKKASISMKTTRVAMPASVSYSRFSRVWDAWYDSFVAEVNDEMGSSTSTQRRLEANARWTTF